MRTYRGTEEVIYLEFGSGHSALGLRPADGGEHRYHEVGIEHLAFREEDYYAFFAFDPDGIRIEVFSWRRE